MVALWLLPIFLGCSNLVKYSSCQISENGEINDSLVRSPVDTALPSSIPGSVVRRTRRDDSISCLQYFCARYSGTNSYPTCLRTYCSNNLQLMAVQRDIADSDSPQVQTRSNSGPHPVRRLLLLTALCASRLCSAESTPAELENCMVKRCGWTQQAPDGGEQNMILSEERVGKIGFIPEGKYGDDQILTDDRAMPCRDGACGLDGSDGSDGLGGPCAGNASNRKCLLQMIEERLARKRRVNDDVSQCIQSYCGTTTKDGKELKPRSRLACIVLNCNRQIHY